MKYKVTVAAAAFATLAAFSFSASVQAGTCQSVKAKGLAKDLATATSYAEPDLKQTAKSMKGKVTQAAINCDKTVSGEFRCKIDAVVCPK